MSRRKIGIVGGSSPQSTVDYYQHLINSYLELANDHKYPETIIYSVEFQKYIDWMNSDQWDRIEDDIVHTIGQLERAGADFGIIAAVTLHKVFPGVAERANIPMLSIVDCVTNEVKKRGIERIGLLGTRFTMTNSFFPKKFAKNGIECLIPDNSDIKLIHDIIFTELSRRIVTDESRAKFIKIINKLENQAAEGVILGCTEIPLLISQKDIELPIFDAMVIHVEAALRESLDALS